MVLAPLVTPHDDLQEFFGGGERQLAHSEVVEDEQGHGDQELHVLFAGAVESGFGQLIEQGVGFAVEHAIPLLDGGLADGLSQMTFASTRRTEKQGVFVASDEGAGRQVEDQAAISSFLLKVKSKLSRVFWESRNWPALSAAPASARHAERVRRRPDRRAGRWGERFGLCLAQTGLQHGGHSAQAKLFERTIEFQSDSFFYLLVL